MEKRQYVFTGKLGLDDLKSLSPYTDDWGTFEPAFDITEEEYNADRNAYTKRVIELNETYIKDLKSQGKYLKEYKIHFKYSTPPEFDSQPDYSQSGILMPKGNLSNEDLPKFNVKYNHEEAKIQTNESSLGEADRTTAPKD